MNQYVTWTCPDCKTINSDRPIEITNSYVYCHKCKATVNVTCEIEVKKVKATTDI